MIGRLTGVDRDGAISWHGPSTAIIDRDHRLPHLQRRWGTPEEDRAHGVRLDVQIRREAPTIVEASRRFVRVAL
jgi:hypothetical protein